MADRSPRLYSVVSGGADAPAVVLLNAIGTSLEMWDPQVPALEQHLRVVRFDARGHGRSDVPPGPYSIAEFADDVVALLDRLEIERASLVGLSLGAMTALRVAAVAPDRVERVVACAATRAPASPQPWLDRAAQVREHGTASIIELVLQRWGYLDWHPEIGERVVSMLVATPDAGYAAACDALACLDLSADLGRIHAPTLLLVGDRDPAAPVEKAHEIAAGMRTAEVTVVPEAAHLMNADQPDLVARLILEFVGTPAEAA